MANFNNKKAESKSVKHVFKVRRVHQFADDSVVFDLDVDDMTVYGCHVREGKNGYFVGMPSVKGKDGKYYSIVFLKLTDDDNALILDQVSEMLAGM